MNNENIKTNNENIKTGYKITRLNLTSFFKPLLFGGIKYKLNQKVYPRKYFGPLCVFDTLDSIKEFFLSYDSTPVNYRVFKCNYEENKKNMIWNDCCKIIYLKWLPSGTKLASWVELTEEIEELY